MSSLEEKKEKNNNENIKGDWRQSPVTVTERSIFFQKVTQVYINQLKIPTSQIPLQLPHCCCCGLVTLSRVRLLAIPWTVAHRLLCPWDSPGKHTGVGCHFLLQGIFPTQGSNPGLLCLLYCRWIIYYWATWEALNFHEMISYMPVHTCNWNFIGNIHMNVTD